MSDFIHSYHSEAEEITLSEDSDVAAATEAIQKKNSQRIYTEVVPKLEELSIKYHIAKNGKSVRFKIGEYKLHLGGRTGGRYTLTILSRAKVITTDQALSDFPGALELSGNSSVDSNRKARIPMRKLDEIMQSISHFAKTISD
ncbi:MAG: hypothetical protein O7D86_04540 [Proteobacteria bacterium]|nr:hypothetical protein [Pseudomonadota bacterium]